MVGINTAVTRASDTQTVADDLPLALVLLPPSHAFVLTGVPVACAVRARDGVALTV